MIEKIIKMKKNEAIVNVLPSFNTDGLADTNSRHNRVKSINIIGETMSIR